LSVILETEERPVLRFHPIPVMPSPELEEYEILIEG